MGITPQELQKILEKTNPPEQSGGFVTSIRFSGVDTKDWTPRQWRACWNGRKFK